MDLTTISAAIDQAGTDISTVGLGIITVAVAVFAFKWIKAAFF